MWWLGATKARGHARAGRLEAVEVSLDGGATGWVLPDDLDETDPVEPWAALLPVLDPTMMGWKERDFYLDPGTCRTSSTATATPAPPRGGTAASSAAGCRTTTAVVRVVLREDVPAARRGGARTEAERLTAWLDGTRISSVYSSLQMKSALLP